MKKQYLAVFSNNLYIKAWKGGPTGTAFFFYRLIELYKFLRNL